MGAALAFCKFFLEGDDLTADIEHVEQSAHSFYSGHLRDQISARFPHHIEIDLD
jgi:hypothetical protein